MAAGPPAIAELPLGKKEGQCNLGNVQSRQRQGHPHTQRRHNNSGPLHKTRSPQWPDTSLAYHKTGSPGGGGTVSTRVGRVCSPSPVYCNHPSSLRAV